MAPQDSPSFFEIEPVGPVTVARFTHDVVLSGQRADAVGKQLGDLLGEPGRQRLLLDFTNVTSLSSHMLSKLVLLNRRAESLGGRLALCNMRPDVLGIFEVTRLTLVLNIYPGEEEALQSF